MKIQWKMESKIGPLFLVATEAGLCGVLWQEDPEAVWTSSLEDSSEAVGILASAVLQIEEYLDGKRRAFDLTLEAQGTEFQKKVWGELSRIPYGETRSYLEIASVLNQEGASRAVGSANGKNPLSIVVPCHRVIASDGTLGGYAGGLEVKRRLLDLERPGEGLFAALSS